MRYNLNVDRIFEGDTTTLATVRNTCDRLVGMQRPEFPWDGIQLPAVPEALRANTIMKPYIKGAVRTGFRFLVWNLKNGGTHGQWQRYHIPIPKAPSVIHQFNIDAPKTKIIWYFCKIEEN